mmetsp:Transcript_14605/g.30728  ORF Transcript_14605/g.30728 Transcript_14605/m.30728 type:complete len:674 (+) Transcript_14605:239-2260(+)
MTKIIKIPCDESISITEEIISDIDTVECGGDAIPSYLMHLVASDDVFVDTTPLIRISHPTSHSISNSDWESMPGLYVYSICTAVHSRSEKNGESWQCKPNLRATRLAMSCGWHSLRFEGDVFVGRLGYVPNYHLGRTELELKNIDLTIDNFSSACLCSPDLRVSVKNEFCSSVAIYNGVEKMASVPSPPCWLENASKKNYLDRASLSALAAAMAREEASTDQNMDDIKNLSSSNSNNQLLECNTSLKEKQPSTREEEKSLNQITLCLHCRGPSSSLCQECSGAYFCDEPRKCKMAGWSHQCICATWRIYVLRRNELSTFPYLADWHLPLLRDDCFISESTYHNYLTNILGVLSPVNIDSEYSTVNRKQTWWATELYGWSGGSSLSAKYVEPGRRRSYIDGFALKDSTLIPEERFVTKEDIFVANEKIMQETQFPEARLIQTDDRGLPILSSWEHYYRLRSLPPRSPAALLGTYPLTLYYAIQRYGIVPLTVAQMLDKPLKIHIVGVEKELNFVDWFQEVGFLLPEEVMIEMTWVVREDMFPQCSQSKSISMQLSTNMKLSIIGGTYGDSIDPNFDVNGGPPDMIIGMNAGLYAYDSWRYVVSYLHHHPNVVGVFTDYNEHSGMNCASLGGGKARRSLEINPFRQPRAMPVYCMNLPQFSNGFIYVFNQQEYEV